MIYDSIDDFLKFYERDTVIFCVGNIGVVSLVENLLHSANRIGMNVVFFALDTEGVDALSSRCDIVKYFIEGVGRNAYDWQTDGHRSVAWHRFPITNDILESGRTCIYMDTDIVIKNNFENDLLSQYDGTDYDCLIQWNSSGYHCTGLYSVRPTKRSLGLFSEESLTTSEYASYRNDQVYFNKYIAQQKLLNIKVLDRDLYPVGKYYYENHKHIDDICNLIHFNFILKQDDKISKMKNFGYWKNE